MEVFSSLYINILNIHFNSASKSNIIIHVTKLFIFSALLHRAFNFLFFYITDMCCENTLFVLNKNIYLVESFIFNGGERKLEIEPYILK